MSNRPPYAVVELTQEQYDFLMRNCESNMTMALGLLTTTTSRTQAEKIVALNEQFKDIRETLKRARI